MTCLDYCAVSTLSEAVEFLKRHPADAVPVAGGTDVMVKARSRDWYKDRYLLDIGGVRELAYIREEGDLLLVGANTTIAEILASDPVKEHAAILAGACENLAGPQVRNKATIGGNLANACLAGDTIPALCVLKAELRIVSPSGERYLPAEELLKPVKACLNHEGMNVAGCYFGCPAGKKTVLGSDELIAEIRIPKLGSDYTQRFIKVGMRQTGCMSKFTFACALKKDGAARISDIRLAIGAAFSDIRLRREADRLTGTEVTKEMIRALADELGDAVETQLPKPGEDLLYRAEVCRRLVNRTLCEMIFGEEE